MRNLEDWKHRDAAPGMTLHAVLKAGYAAMGFGCPGMAAEDTILELRGKAGPLTEDVLRTAQAVIKAETPEGSENRRQALALIDFALEP